MPLGFDDLVSTGKAVNRLPLRTPLDYAYLVKNEGVLKGTGEFFKIYFAQVCYLKIMAGLDQTSLDILGGCNPKRTERYRKFQI